MHKFYKPDSGEHQTIEQSKNSLQTLIGKLQTEFLGAHKSEQKEVEKGPEGIGSLKKFTEAIAKANEMIFMLSTRLTETKNHAERLAHKHGVKIP